nr:acyl-CoA thioesterase [Oceanococcus sp. HetDA_MAG_MS8]
MDWDLPQPFVWSVQVPPSAIDIMGHVNNVQYLQWLERCAWEHTQHLGLSWERYQELGCGVVAIRHEIDYLRPAFASEVLEVGTWCTANDGRLRLRRQYQIIRPADGSTLVRAQTDWVCVDLASGRPRRMPDEFKTAYRPVSTPEVASGDRLEDEQGPQDTPAGP